MKALLFGGTFDPPHAGHMNNLRAAMQAVQPDVVLVMPAGIPPHKHASATPGELRLAMCECFKALGPQVQVSQWEVDRAGRSYTYNTVSMLQEKYPGAQLYMTIGSDMLETFDEWYRWREILAMVTLVVQSREPGDGDALRAAAQKLEEAGGKIRVPMPHRRRALGGIFSYYSIVSKNLQHLCLGQFFRAVVQKCR